MDNAAVASILEKHVKAVNAHLPQVLIWPIDKNNTAAQTVNVSTDGLKMAEELTEAGIFDDRTGTILIAHSDFRNSVIPPIHTVLTLNGIQCRVKTITPHQDGKCSLLTVERVAG